MVNVRSTDPFRNWLARFPPKDHTSHITVTAVKFTVHNTCTVMQCFLTIHRSTMGKVGCLLERLNYPDNNNYSNQCTSQVDANKQINT